MSCGKPAGCTTGCAWSAASFLVKDLLVPWQEGAAWFWDTLVDADLANNTLGWQWTAGCGADAAPYFRIFNPVSQGERFDPERRLRPPLGSGTEKFAERVGSQAVGSACSCFARRRD